MKTKFKILFVSPFFYPEKISSAKYNKYLVDHLLSALDLDVYCLNPFYPRWVSVKAKKYKNVFRPNWLPIFPKSFFLRRLILELGFFIHFFYFTLCNKKKYQGIICISPPSLFLLIAIFFRKRILIIHDLQSVHSSQASPFLRLVSGIIKISENLLFRIFQYKIFLSKEMMREHNLPNSHVYYPPYSIKKNINNKFVKKYNFNNKSIIYSGALGEKQNPIELIELINKFIVKTKDYQCFIFSSGSYYDFCKKKFKNSKINFFELVNDNDLFSLYDNNAIHLIPQKSYTSNGSLPSKLSNLIFSNSKILTITDKNSELDQILKNYKNNISIYNWGFNNFYKGITKLSSFKRQKISLKNKSIFDINNMVNDIVNFIK